MCIYTVRCWRQQEGKASVFADEETVHQCGYSGYVLGYCNLCDPREFSLTDYKPLRVWLEIGGRQKIKSSKPKLNDGPVWKRTEVMDSSRASHNSNPQPINLALPFLWCVPGVTCGKYFMGDSLCWCAVLGIVSCQRAEINIKTGSRYHNRTTSAPHFGRLHLMETGGDGMFVALCDSSLYTALDKGFDRAEELLLFETSLLGTKFSCSVPRPQPFYTSDGFCKLVPSHPVVPRIVGRNGS